MHIIGGDDDLADAGWVLNEIQPRRMTHQTDLSLFNIIFRWDVPACGTDGFKLKHLW